VIGTGGKKRQTAGRMRVEIRPRPEAVEVSASVARPHQDIARIDPDPEGGPGLAGIKTTRQMREKRQSVGKPGGSEFPQDA